MSKTLNRLLSLGELSVLLIWACVGAGAQVIRMDSVPAGLRPLGVDTVVVRTGLTYAAVANSGDNTVSIFRMNLDTENSSGPKTINLTATVAGIPSPYSVVPCFGTRVLVTSPLDNSVRLLDLASGTVVGTVQVGPQPYSAACFVAQNIVRGAASNLGDSSLVIFDLDTMAITARIAGVPGSRGLHGIAASANSTVSTVAWVAGTDANVVTVVDMINFKVLTQIPVSRPTAVRTSGGGSTAFMSVASAGSNSITTYDRDTVQVISNSTFQGVPNPQDFVVTAFGYLATIGGQDSLWRLNGTSTTTIAGIPGAAALAATTFGALSQDYLTAILVTSTNSNSVFMIQRQPPLPAQFGIANGASFVTSSSAPGALASAFASTGVSQPTYANSLPLQVSLAGLSVRIGGTIELSANAGYTYSPAGSFLAPLQFVGPTQVNFQIPPGATVGNSVPAQLTRADGSALLTTVNLAASAPGIFTVLQNGQGQGAVLNQDSSLNGDPQTRVGTRPAARGSVIQIFATGAGATMPALDAGQPAPASGNPLILTQVQPTVTIGGKAAPVQFSGMAPGFVGLWQINAVVPADTAPSMTVPLSITAGGQTSNTVTIAVQ